jgi:hypothetical protein
MMSSTERACDTAKHSLIACHHARRATLLATLLQSALAAVAGLFGCLRIGLWMRCPPPGSRALLWWRPAGRPARWCASSIACLCCRDVCGSNTAAVHCSPAADAAAYLGLMHDPACMHLLAGLAALFMCARGVLQHSGCPTVCRPPQRTWTPPGSLRGSTRLRSLWTPPQRQPARCLIARVLLLRRFQYSCSPKVQCVRATSTCPCHMMTKHLIHTLFTRFTIISAGGEEVAPGHGQPGGGRLPGAPAGGGGRLPARARPRRPCAALSGALGTPCRWLRAVCCSLHCISSGF